MSERDPIDGTNRLLGYIIGIIAAVMLAYTFYPVGGVLP
jgi:uncharacterized membrane protein required for colicin V production